MAILLAVPLVTAGINVLGGIFGAGKAAKAQRKAKAEQARARKEMNRLKGIYSNLDTSNPFLNMENTMEDLSINQKQAQFQAQQFQQSQANILNSVRGAAGGSGIAALAQSLAQQGQLASQQSAANIGQQEAANKRAAAQQASSIQAQERRGEVMSRNLERDQVGTLLGMSQSETAAAREQQVMAQQAKFNAISSGITGATSAIGSGLMSGAFDGLGGGGDNVDDILSGFGNLSYQGV